MHNLSNLFDLTDCSGDFEIVIMVARRDTKSIAWNLVVLGTRLGKATNQNLVSISIANQVFLIFTVLSLSFKIINSNCFAPSYF